MSSFIDKVKNVAEKASDKYQEKKNSSSKDEGTYDPSKNDDYSSSNQQSSNEVCHLRFTALQILPSGKQHRKMNCSFPSNTRIIPCNFAKQVRQEFDNINFTMNVTY